MSTIHDADRDGAIAALSCRNTLNSIPPAYADSPALREAWVSAFEKTRQAFRGTPVEAPRTKKEATEDRKPRKPKAQEAPEPRPAVTQRRRTMADILAEQHHEHA